MVCTVRKFKIPTRLYACCDWLEFLALFYHGGNYGGILNEQKALGLARTLIFIINHVFLSLPTTADHVQDAKKVEFKISPLSLPVHHTPLPGLFSDWPLSPDQEKSYGHCLGF